MKTITCLAIDDEPLALKQLAAYIGKIPFLRLVAACPSALDARRILDEEAIDAVFCDINMPDLNGMDFVKSLSAPPLVVFTTAYADYAIEGYKVDAIDYLLKPFGLDEFRNAANKIKERMRLLMPDDQETTRLTTPPPMPTEDTESTPEPQGGKGDDTSLFVKTDGRTVKINIADIVYVEGMSEYLKIHLDGTGVDGRPQRPVIILFSMKRLEERLPAHFMRIHRSYLINLRKIQEINKNRVIMGAENYLPIGDLYKETLTEYVNRNFLGK